MIKPRKPPKPNNEENDPVMERMNEALKRMMNTPHETQKEMVQRRRRQGDSTKSKG